MSEITEQSLEEMFLEMFAGWKDRIEKTERVSDDEIKVLLKDGRKYRFGVKPNRDIYLKTIPSQK